MRVKQQKNSVTNKYIRLKQLFMFCQSFLPQLKLKFANMKNLINVSGLGLTSVINNNSQKIKNKNERCIPLPQTRFCIVLPSKNICCKLELSQFNQALVCGTLHILYTLLVKICYVGSTFFKKIVACLTRNNYFV